MPVAHTLASLLGLALLVACSPSPAVPAPNPEDPFIGTWERDGAATFASSEVYLRRRASGASDEEAARLLEEARAEIVDAPWTIAVAVDGTLALDARTRRPGAQVLTDEHWIGTWENEAGAITLVVQTGAADELTRLKGQLDGDHLTIGGPPGTSRGLVLEFVRRTP